MVRVSHCSWQFAPRHQNGSTHPTVGSPPGPFLSWQGGSMQWSQCLSTCDCEVCTSCDTRRGTRITVTSRTSQGSGCAHCTASAYHFPTGASLHKDFHQILRWWRSSNETLQIAGENSFESLNHAVLSQLATAVSFDHFLSFCRVYDACFTVCVS